MNIYCLFGKYYKYLKIIVNLRNLNILIMTIFNCLTPFECMPYLKTISNHAYVFHLAVGLVAYPYIYHENLEKK